MRSVKRVWRRKSLKRTLAWEALEWFRQAVTDFWEGLEVVFMAMEKDTAETIVKVYAVLAWISALIAAVAGIGILVGGSIMGGFGMMGGRNMITSGFLAGLAVIFAIFLLVMAIFYVFVGVGLWNKKDWARIAAIVFSVLSLFSFPIGTVIGAFGIYFFGFEETMTGLFLSKGSAKSAGKKQGKKSK